MNEDNDDTEVAPTELAQAPAQVTAWGDYLDDDNTIELHDDNRRTWWYLSVSVAVAALLVVMLALVWFITAHSQRGSAPATARIAPPSMTVVSSMPSPTAPPVTSTVTAMPVPPVSVAPSPPYPGLDDRYINLVPDESRLGGRDRVIQLGHLACTSLAATHDLGATEIVMVSTYGLSEAQAQIVSTAASAVYCKGTGTNW
jgi:hypothetical protein